MNNFLTLIFTVLLLCASVNGEDLRAAKPTLKVGNWTVLRTMDAMTDKVECTGIYKSNYGIQLAGNRLFVTVAGGIQAVTLRFGEAPPEAMRLVIKREKELGAVIIDGADFFRALTTTRVLVQILTLVRGVKIEDIDTAGMQSAVDHINSGCPLKELI